MLGCVKSFGYSEFCVGNPSEVTDLSYSKGFDVYETVGRGP